LLKGTENKGFLMEFIMNNEQTNLLHKATEKWGKTSQVMMALEEMSELSIELIKNINRNISNEREILEEIGDVCIMLEQLKIIYGFSDKKLQDSMDKKLERLKNILNC
jgi:NTP pyrophosphatase (non-canonical NTP hydrolase)